MNHTPGPWTSRNGSICSKDGQVVAFTGRHRPLDEANATLIAAAPKMLKALEAVQRARNIKDAGRADDAMSDADILVEEALDQAKAAPS